MKISDYVDVDIALTRSRVQWPKTPKFTPLARRVLHRKKVKKRVETRAFKEFVKCWYERKIHEWATNPFTPLVTFQPDDVPVSFFSYAIKRAVKIWNERSRGVQDIPLVSDFERVDITFRDKEDK